MHPWVAGNLILKPAYAVLREPVGRYFSSFERTQWLSPAELRDYQAGRLRAVLRHVRQHVPYYQRRSETAAALESRDTLAALGLLPVLTRDDIRRNLRELQAPTPHFATATRKTSGSTGSPLLLHKDRVATGAMNAVMWRNYGWFGIRAGDRQARAWAGPLSRWQSCRLRVSDCLQNRIRMSSLVMTAEVCSQFVTRLERFRPQYMYGYGQALYRLAEYVHENRIDLAHLRLKAAITTAERISAAQRRTIEDAFRTRAVNEYGCTESGVIAMQCPAGMLHVMSDNLLVEVLHNGLPAEPGQEGDIVITELHGSRMPLIRYRVGDRGILSATRCACGRGLPVLQSFTGRTTDLIVCPDGTTIDPDMVDFFLKLRPEFYASVRQWHIRQISRRSVLITLCTPHAVCRPEIAAYLEDRFHDASRRQLAIEVRFDEWLVPAVTGKTRVFSSDVYRGEEVAT